MENEPNRHENPTKSIAKLLRSARPERRLAIGVFIVAILVQVGAWALDQPRSLSCESEGDHLICRLSNPYGTAPLFLTVASLFISLLSYLVWHRGASKFNSTYSEQAMAGVTAGHLSAAALAKWKAKWHLVVRRHTKWFLTGFLLLMTVVIFGSATLPRETMHACWRNGSQEICDGFTKSSPWLLLFPLFFEVGMGLLTVILHSVGFRYIQDLAQAYEQGDFSVAAKK